MLEMQGIPKVLLENVKIIFSRAQYVVKPGENGKIVNRIWLFPLFTKTWICLPPIDRIEDEEIDPAPLEALVNKVLQEDNEQLAGFAYIESYWAENPNGYVFYGFFDQGKRSATQMETYITQVKDSDAYQIFLDFSKQRMYDEPFEATSQELQELAAKLVGLD